MFAIKQNNEKECLLAEAPAPAATVVLCRRR